MPEDVTTSEAVRSALRPVFLEPRDDRWQIHRPEHVSADEQREYQLAAQATAEQLDNAIRCDDCFPRRRGDEAN